MADLQFPGPNHKEYNCIPKELVRYSGVYFFTRGVASQTHYASKQPLHGLL